ncbi:DUF177 domain-containing protein [Mycolicibacterium sp.]|uniref:YceD family protein n=1 Tax=Mycolicibacterium sp. TaxID=2320850 RepID=UPI001A2CAF1B|nr:DUF177 domain-containing protein [Mycolicibacterium sp.]MBJ7336328.1 DUF177 domain-containing protein [Mycolicibacterium sp.]
MAGKSKHHAHRGPRSSFVLDVSRLGMRPGSMITFDETVASPARIGIELIAIPEGAPVHLDLRLESVSEGVLVSGPVSAPTAGECARCLTPVTGDVEIYLTELFAYPDSATEATTDDDDEVGRVVDDTVDLEQPIIDAVGMQLPFSPLCRDDCPGLCPECGAALADYENDADPHHHDVIDPRWAKLAALKPVEDGAPDPAAGGRE